MIRPANSNDYDAIVTIWLQASLIAHDFIPAHFWAEHAQQMRDSYLPNAETLVIEEDGAIKGYGKRLLAFALQQRQRLDLCVPGRVSRDPVAHES